MPILIYVVTSPLTYRASQCPRLQSNSPDCPAVSENSQTWALPGTKWAMPMSFKSLEEEKSGRRRCKFNPTSQQMLAASWPSLTLITHLVACLAMTVMILRLRNLLMLSKASSRLSRLHPVGSKCWRQLILTCMLQMPCAVSIEVAGFCQKKHCFPMCFYFPRSFLLNSPCFGFLRYDARPNHCHQ